MKTSQNFHFLGIGGVSMSALGQILTSLGKNVTGEDLQKTCLPKIDTNPSHAQKNLENADEVVVSCAIPPNDKTLLFAKNVLKKKITSRGELLGRVTKNFNTTIAVSGTHGKTSTTEMLAEVLIEANLQPTIHIGGVSNKFHSNFLIGQKKYFVTEACEFGNSFLGLCPDVAVILNIEPEHLDFFGTFKNMQASFLQFAKQAKIVVANKLTNIPNAITFGQNGNYELTSLTQTTNGFRFSVNKNKKFFGTFEINSINKKNVENALSVIAVCDVLNIDKKICQNALKNFCGVERRLQTLSTNPLVVHDYAHHPTEIENIICDVQSFYKKPVTVVFQPHTYSRTKNLFCEFVRVLKIPHKTILLPTFPAREPATAGKTSEDLFNALKKQNANVLFCKNFRSAKKTLSTIPQNEIILILGAGDIVDLWKKNSKD